MKKIIHIVLICLSCFISVALAHPPKDIIINYNLQTHMLNATIKHDVANPVPHHIKEVDVFLNDTKILSHLISVQDNHETQTVSYLIPDAKMNDTLAVEAFCSIHGSLKKQITVK